VSQWGLVPSSRGPHPEALIPAKAGIHFRLGNMDPRFRGDDGGGDEGGGDDGDEPMVMNPANGGTNPAGQPASFRLTHYQP
jgi:hypothetical protein